MKLGEAEIWLRQELKSIYDEREASNIADLVLENLSGLSRVDRLTKKEERLVVQQLHHQTEIHHRLLHHEPIQYALGVALFRQEVARGMTEAAEQMKQANLDTNVILFSMWTEAIKNFAEYGKGNVIFLDGSSDGMEKTMKQIQALMMKPAGLEK